MKKAKQETSLKHSLRKSINYFVCSGLVINTCELKKTRKHLFARTRLKIRSYSGTSAYSDFYAFDDIAKEMNLLCQIGDVVLIVCHLTNKIYVNKKGEKKAKVYFMVDDIERITKTNKKNLAKSDVLEILDELDPANYTEVAKII